MYTPTARVLRFLVVAFFPNYFIRLGAGECHAALSGGLFLRRNKHE
jgi:hypothetical protein